MDAVQQVWNAQDYAANSSAQYGWGCELVDKLTLLGDEHILDIGCGDGKLTALLAQRVPTGVVVGIDASAEMVALASERWGEGDRLMFQQMNAQEIRSATDLAGRFDVVFSNSALHWIPDHPAVLAGVHHALRSGGQVLIQTPGAGNCAAFVDAADRVRMMPRWCGYFTDFRFSWLFCELEDYVRWLPQAGFQIDAIERQHKDMCHESREALAGWMRTTWLPYLACVPEGERAAFIDAVVDGYLADVPPDAAGRTHVAMVRLDIAAMKL